LNVLHSISFCFFDVSNSFMIQSELRNGETETAELDGRPKFSQIFQEKSIRPRKFPFSFVSKFSRDDHWPPWHVRCHW
jgi:hypothetical protein